MPQRAGSSLSLSFPIWQEGLGGECIIGHQALTYVWLSLIIFTFPGLSRQRKGWKSGPSIPTHGSKQHREQVGEGPARQPSASEKAKGQHGMSTSRLCARSQREQAALLLTWLTAFTVLPDVSLLTQGSPSGTLRSWGPRLLIQSWRSWVPLSLGHLARNGQHPVPRMCASTSWQGHGILGESVCRVPPAWGSWEVTRSRM